MPLWKNKKVLINTAVIACFLGGWKIYDVFTDKPANEVIIPLVKTVTIGTSDIAANNVYPGEVKGRYESNLAFQVSGKINKRLVNIGDKVQQGQILLQIDPKDVLQSVENSNAQYASALANQKLAAENVRRYTALYESGAVSKAALDQYTTQLEAANAALRQAGAQSNISQNQLEYTNLRSDVDGVVTNITGEVGQIAAAGNPIVTVIQNGEREIQIFIPENKLSEIKIDQKAEVTFWALNKLKLSGQVREISPVADPVTKTYKVRVAVNNLPPEANLGMTAKVHFTGNNKEQIILPLSSIYQTDNQTKVWVVRNNHAVTQPVEVAGYSDNNVIISSGLSKDDIVIVGGISKLVENQQVKVTESGDLL